MIDLSDFSIRFYSCLCSYYRLQRSWGKVKNSVQRGEVGLQADTRGGGEVGGSGPEEGVGLQAHTQGEVEGSGQRGVSRPTPRGEVRGSGQGVSRPTPGGKLGALAWGSPSPCLGGLQAHIWEVSRWCIPACTEADIPLLSRRLLLQAVRILLECILLFLLMFCFIVNTFGSFGKIQNGLVES